MGVHSRHPLAGICTIKGGHYYRKINGIWVCVDCDQPEPNVVIGVDFGDSSEDSDEPATDY